MLPEYSNAEIVRTRDPELLSQCDVVVDVGGVFDHDAKRYDHHQETFDLTMRKISEGNIDSDIQLSSARRPDLLALPSENLPESPTK